MALEFVVINRNNAAILDQTLTTLPPGHRVTFVDDASDDDSVERARALMPEARIVRHAMQLGPTAARLTGLETATAEIVAVVDSDTRVSELPLEAVVAFFADHPGCAVVGPEVRDEHDNVVGWQASVDPNPWIEYLLVGGYSVCRRIGARFLARRFQATLAPWLYPRRQRVKWVSGQCMVIRSAALADATFDRLFVMFYEEPDLCRRLRQKGWEIWRNPEWTVAVRPGGVGAASDLRSRWSGESRARYLAKHLPVAGALGDRLAGPRLGPLYGSSGILDAVGERGTVR